MFGADNPVQLDIDDRWLKREIPNECDVSKCMLMPNEVEILCADGQYNETGKGIHKYNSIKNKWERFATYPSDADMQCFDMAMKKDANKLYLCKFNGTMMIFDVNAAKWEIYNQFDNLSRDNHSPRLLNINGTIHLIGGSCNGKHLIWNDNNNTFEEIYDFKYDQILDHSLVFVPSKQKIFMLGGTHWIENKGRTSIGNWIYCLQTDKWTKREDIQFDVKPTSPVLTANEQYIIMIAQEILIKGRLFIVLDIRDDNKYKLYKTSIRTPHQASIIRTGGLKLEMLVIGWIKSIFKTQIFKDLELPPMEIMKLISLYNSQEQIHWITSTYYGPQHFVIETKHILASLL